MLVKMERSNTPVAAVIEKIFSLLLMNKEIKIDRRLDGNASILKGEGRIAMFPPTRKEWKTKENR